jgi:D-arabinose 1-dehydrogenase-like Zn-dependent alcohol dehydrogenase
MKQNSVNAAVMTAPGKFEVRCYPYPEIDDVSMVIELEMCGICGTDKHTFRGETAQYAGTPAESHTPFPIIPGQEIAGVFADVGGIPINPHRHLLANQMRYRRLHEGRADAKRRVMAG